MTGQGMAETLSTQQLEDEIVQTYETLVALIQREDEIHDVTGESPIAEKGHLIKSAGILRDELHPDDETTYGDIDPDEVFGDDRAHHPCGHLDYDSMYVTLLQASYTLAEEGHVEQSRDLWATVVGFRDVMAHD